MIRILISFLSLCLRVLPQAARLWLGRLLGKLLKRFSPRRVAIAKTNLDLCFPNLSECRRRALLNEHIASVGQGILEGVMAWRFPASLLARFVDIEGRCYLAQAKSEARPILLFGLHTTSIDLTPPFLSTVLEAAGVYKPMRHDTLDALVLRGRLRHADAMFVQTDMRGMLAHLQRGGHLWYASDQDFGLVAKGEFAPFFGQSAHTLPLYAKLAQRTNAQVLPVGVFRNPSTGRYVMRFLPVLSVSDYDSELKAAQTANRTIEQLCSGYESQYYWVHRRFKTQADGRNVYAS